MRRRYDVGQSRCAAVAAGGQLVDVFLGVVDWSTCDDGADTAGGTVHCTAASTLYARWRDPHDAERFGLAHIAPERVVRAFPDLAPGTLACPRGCTHLEPDCALDDWVRDQGGEAAVKAWLHLAQAPGQAFRCVTGRV